MNRPPVFAVLGLLLLAAVPVGAAEVPHLEFVRGLREQHYPDLALEYLEKLAKNPPADIAARIPLEMARARLDMAATTPDVSKRLSLYTEARQSLADFLQKNPQSPLAGPARLDLARVSVLQGRTQLSQALREDKLSARIAEAAKARPLLEDAGKQLGEVVKVLDAQLQNAPEPQTPAQKAERKELEDARLQAELDQGLTLFDLGRTYVETQKDEVAKARANVFTDASKVLKRVAARDDKNSICWQAKAWAARCDQELGASFKDVDAQYRAIIAETGKFNDVGRRLARAFQVQATFEAPDQPGKNRIKEVKDEASRWLKDYATFGDTPEAATMRYCLVRIDLEQADAIKTPAARKPLYDEAKLLCKELSQTENEYTRQAQKLKIGIIQEEGGFKGDVASLTNFDDCYVRAQYEAFQLEKKDLSDADRAKGEKAVIAALVRALDLVDNKKQKAPEEDVNNARAALAFAYMNNGDLRAAAAIGEKLAQLPSRPPQAGEGAIYALHCYSQLVANPEAANLKPEEARDYRERLRRFADQVKKLWPQDAPGDVARHELGLLDIREENYPAAVEELSSIHPGYSGAIFAGYQLAMAALEAAKKNAKPLGADKRPWEQRAIEALEKLPDLPKGSDPATTYIYVMAKLKLGQFLYQEKKYAEMEALAKPLVARLQANELTFDSKEKGDEAREGLETLRLAAVGARAEAENRAGHYDQVWKLLEPVVQEAKEGKVSVFETKPELRTALLGMAVRAQIQLGKMDEAQQVLDLLQTYASKGGELAGGGANTMLLQVAQLIQGQIRDIHKKPEAEQTKMKESLLHFLDKLAAQQQSKALTLEARILLAQCYSSLDAHKKAGELLTGVPEPKAEAAAKDKAQWQYIEIMRVRELRLDKQLDKADEELAKILGNAKNPGWGAKNLEARKEQVMLLQDRDKYYEAATEWNKLVKALLPQMSNPAMKDQYLECYYWLVYSLYKNAQKLDEAKRKQGIQQAAAFMVDLEAKWPDFGTDVSKARFQDLLEKEPDLKEAYEQKKQATKGGP